QIIKLELIRGRAAVVGSEILGDKFPTAAEPRAIAFMLEAQRARAFIPAGEQRLQTLSFQWQHNVAGELGGVTGTGDIYEGGHQVNQMTRLVFPLIGAGKALRPVNDHRRANSALVIEVLE